MNLVSQLRPLPQSTPPPTPIRPREAGRRPGFLFSSLPNWLMPSGQPALAFSVPRSGVQTPLTLTLRPTGRNHPAFLAALVRAGPRGAGSGRPPRTHWPLPRGDPARPRSAPDPARRSPRGGNLPQSRAYVHRAGSAPSPGGPRALRSAACCRRSAGATPIRYRRMGTATGSRWTAGYPSSARRLGAWGLACMGGAGVGRPVCKLPPLPPSSPTPSPAPSLRQETLPGREQVASPHIALVPNHSRGRLWARAVPRSQVALGVKNLPAEAADVKGEGSIPGWGRSPGGGHGNPLQSPCLENPMDREAWWGYSEAIVHGVTKSWRRRKRPRMCSAQLS